MKRVLVMRWTDENPGIVAVFTWTATDGVQCDDARFLADLEHEGIAVPPDGERVYPRDGLRFLEGLQFHFRGGNPLSAGAPADVPEGERALHERGEPADPGAAMPQRLHATIGGMDGSHVVTLHRGAVVYSIFEPMERREAHSFIVPTAEQWREFRQALDALRVWQWRADYPNSGMILDGEGWSFAIVYADKAITTASNGRPIGQPRRTTTFRRYLAAVGRLAGRTFD